ncbi:MAG: hypothetical protein HYR67_04220 [Bacteroidetes bacterium]|nr:hypothetical protein [Bacteroidota bacterium]
MKRIGHLIVLSLSLILVADSQSNRDSLLLHLYKQGQISRDTYYRSLSKSEVAKEIKLATQNLREQLKYKFVLDFLLEYRTEDGKPLADTTEINDPEFISKREGKKLGKDILEQFELGGLFSLYKVKSTTGVQDYYLVVNSETEDPTKSALDFSLLGNDTKHWNFFDSFYFHGHGGGFQFDTLNRYNVIKVKRLNSGSPHSSEDEAYLGIVNDKFRVLFSTRRLELFSPERRDPIRTMRNIKFVDLNGDGFLDILEETKVEAVVKDELGKIKQYEEISRVKAKKMISKGVHKYYWNNSSYSFDRMK